MAEAEKTDVFFSADERRDFAVVVEGRQVYVCREYLACLSPVFQHIFYPDGAPFKQPDGGMQMKEKKLPEFLLFLHAVCPTPGFSKVKESSLATLWAYADEYDVEGLRQRCTDFMLLQLERGSVYGKHRIDYLQLATKYRLDDLQKELIPLVAQLSIDQIKAAHGSLPLAPLAAVYQSKLLNNYNQFVTCNNCGQKCSTFQENGRSVCCGSLLLVRPATVTGVGLCARCVANSVVASLRPVDFSTDLLDKKD